MCKHPVISFSQPAIREGAVEALRACFAICAQREMKKHHYTHWYQVTLFLFLIFLFSLIFVIILYLKIPKRKNKLYNNYIDEKVFFLS